MSKIRESNLCIKETENFFKFLRIVLKSIKTRYVIIHTQLPLENVIKISQQLHFNYTLHCHNSKIVESNYNDRKLINAASSILDCKTLEVYHLVMDGIYPTQWKITPLGEFIRTYTDRILAMVIEELPKQYLYDINIIERDICSIEKIVPPKISIPGTIDSLMWVHELIMDKFAFPLYSKILTGFDTSVKWYWIYKKIDMGPPVNLNINPSVIHLWEAIRSGQFFPKLLKMQLKIQ